MIWNFIKERMLLNQKSTWSDNNSSFTYAEALSMSGKIGNSLAEKLSSKSKCAILCEKQINTALALLACWKADMVPIPMSRSYGENHYKNIVYLINPDVLITDNLDTLGDIAVPVFDLLRKEFNTVLDDIPFEEELADVALVMCTSGTTGSPKGAMITSEGLISNIRDISEYFLINSEDKVLIARPLYHCAVLTGEYLISLYNGVSIHFFDEGYDPALILNEVKNDVTVLCGTPTLFYHLSIYARRQSEPSLLKSIAISGECLSSDIAKTIRNAFPHAEIYNVYGLTEASPRVSYLPPDLFDQYPESVGVPLQSIAVKIIDDSGSEVPNGIDGNLIVKGPNVMKGYYNNPDLTQKTIKRGWLHTGDIAHKNINGLLFIKSRSDDMIIKAGMNIFPQEIEQALIQHSAIKEVLAYGIKSKTGQSIALNVVLSDLYINQSVKNIMDICADSLPRYLLPKQINIVESIEKNASGKTIRPRG